MRRSIRRSSLVVALSGVVSGVAAWFLIVPVFGAEFSGSVVPAILIIGSVGIGVSAIFVEVCNATGRPAVGS